MQILDFLPDWRAGLTENRTYLTDIMLSNNQTEQRAALRDKPRCDMAYSLLMTGQDASRFDWIMSTSQAQPMLMPYWPAPHHLAAPLANGSTGLLLDGPMPAWVIEGIPLVLMHSSRDSLAVTVKTIAGDQVELMDPVLGTWPKGSLVYPCWEVTLPNSIPFKRHTPTVTAASLTLTRTITGDAVPVATSAPDMMYSGLEVLTRDINWRDGQDVDMTWLTQLMDGQRGRTSYEVLSAQQQRTSGGSVLLQNQDVADWWFGFFDRNKGRRGAFYAPTRSRDLPLVPSPTPTTSRFAVAGTKFHELMQPGRTMLTHMMIRRKDGSYRLFKISNLVVDHVNNVTYIRTVETWSESYPPEQALSHYLASQCRLGADALTISWKLAGIGETQVSVTTVGANW